MAALHGDENEVIEQVAFAARADALYLPAPGDQDEPDTKRAPYVGNELVQIDRCRVVAGKPGEVIEDNGKAALVAVVQAAAYLGQKPL